MKIKIKENGEIFLDEKTIEFTANVLEEILNSGIENNLEIIDESKGKYNDTPYVALINGINDAVQENSDFMKQLKELEKIKEEEEKKLETIQNG